MSFIFEDPVDGDMIVTIDVSAIYTNISQEDAIKACRDVLDKHSDDKPKNDFIILLICSLWYNIF